MEKAKRKKRVEKPRWFDKINTKPWTVRHFPTALRHKLKRMADIESEKAGEIKTLEEMVVEILTDAAKGKRKK